LLSTFLDLVKIDSLTFNEKSLANYIGKCLKKMGISFEIDSAGKQVGSNTGNLVARIPARGKSKARPILFAAHMDTVAPGTGVQPVVKNGTVRSKGDTILGADDKAGCAIILESLQSLREGNLFHGDIEVVFTIAEEKGLLGAKCLDFDKLKAKWGFVMDGDGTIGNIIVKAPYQDALKMVFKGKAAHAGVNPENGINAIRAASVAISKMKLGRIDEETTANMGVIRGGRAINIVPDETIVEGEARSHSKAKLKVQIRQMLDCAKEANKEVGTKTEVELKRLYDGFAFGEKDKVVSLAMEAARRIEVTPKLVASGGGSDTNIFNKKGIEAVNLSVGARDVHTTSESVSVEAMVKAAEMVIHLIELAGAR
jgi:tripeptide aminopeptidase